MYKVISRPVRFSHNKTTYTAGKTITKEEFEKELPEDRRRARIVSQMLETRRIVEVPDKSGKVELDITKEREQLIKAAEATANEVITSRESEELEYIPVGRYRLPNGEIVKGKDKALERLKEI